MKVYIVLTYDFLGECRIDSVYANQTDAALRAIRLRDMFAKKREPTTAHVLTKTLRANCSLIKCVDTNEFAYVVRL